MKAKTKRFAIVGFTSILSVCALASALLGGESLAKTVTGAEGTYTLTLDKDQKPSEDATSAKTFTAKTAAGNSVGFSYEKMTCTTDSTILGVLSDTGTIKNTAPLHGLQSVVITNGDSENDTYLIVYYGWSATVFSKRVALELDAGTSATFNAASGMGGNPDYLIIEAAESDVTIGSIAFTYSCVGTSAPGFSYSFDAATSTYCWSDYDGSETTFTMPATYDDGTHGVHPVTTVDGSDSLRNNLTFTSIVFGSSVTAINDESFMGDDTLTTISLPAGLASLGDGAFQSCSNLATINYGGTTTEWAGVSVGTDAFKEVSASKIICSDGDVTL